MGSDPYRFVVEDKKQFAGEMLGKLGEKPALPRNCVERDALRVRRPIEPTEPRNLRG